jgi:CheY-like chemotaxis protein
MNDMYRILVVDDHDLIRNTLKKALDDEGYEVFLAENGARCFEIVESKEIDLILLDMRLPDMNGLEILRRLKAGNPDSVVLVMTAYGDPDSARKAMNLGAFDFIHKPVKARAITSIIKMAMEIRSLRREIRQIIFKNKERYGYHNIIGKSEAFALKGLWLGLATAAVLVAVRNPDLTAWPGRFEAIAWFLLIPAITAYLAMNFTGASTYTSLSGVKKEMRWALPLEIGTGIMGLGLWAGSRFLA